MAPPVRRVDQFTGTIVRSEADDFVLELDRIRELETRCQELEAEVEALRVLLAPRNEAPYSPLGPPSGGPTTT